MSRSLVEKRYDVLERLGEGVLFQAFKVRERAGPRTLTVKTFAAHVGVDSSLNLLVKQSLTGITDLSHPNIARLLGVDDDEGSVMVLQEYIRGINLKERIQRIAPFSLGVAVDYGLAMAEAIAHAHLRGTVHGDLRPHNIVVSPEGAVKVMDFGLWPVLQGHQFRDRHNEVAAPYTPPEASSDCAVSPQHDIYALGAVLYEMLTGSLPARRLAAEGSPAPDVQSPRELNAGVPRCVEGIVLKCLKAKSADRYSTARALVTDLKRVQDALRFGNSLNWSPLDDGSADSSTIVVPPAVTVAAAPTVAKAPERPGKVNLPEVTTSSAATEPPPIFAMDDRVSPYIKVALGTVTAVIVVTVVLGVAWWMAMMAKPAAKPLANLVGLQFEDAQSQAARAGVKLQEHDEFSDKAPEGQIIRSDWQAGRPVHAGRSINVWVSRGSRLVWVPNLVGMTAQQAQDALKTAGLALGQVDREYTDKVEFGAISKQNPSTGKRVSRDIAVNLVVSDGPKPAPDTGDSSATNAPDSGNGAPDQTGSVPNPNVQDLSPHTYNMHIAIKRDGRGRRLVRVEYDDSQGTHIPVDEDHVEGETIAQTLQVFGPRITIRVYYGDDITPVAQQSLNLPAAPTQ